MWPCWQRTMMSSIFLMSHDLSQPIRTGWEITDAPVREGPHSVGVWTLKILARLHNIVIFTILHSRCRKGSSSIFQHTSGRYFQCKVCCIHIEKLFLTFRQKSLHRSTDFHTEHQRICSHDHTMFCMFEYNLLVCCFHSSPWRYQVFWRDCPQNNSKQLGSRQVAWNCFVENWSKDPKMYCCLQLSAGIP